MMEKDFQDKGIRKIMQESGKFRLSSNFTYRTMRKVEEGVCLQEKKQERRMLIVAILISLFLFSGGAFLIAFYWKESWGEALCRVFRPEVQMDFFSSEWSILGGLILILILFDYWMRRTYDKYHRPE